MRFVELFVRRPVVAIVVNLLILLIGLRAAQELPVQQFPQIESASIVVTTVYVGAPAEVVKGFITTPVERAVSSISGVDYVESSSVAGVSTVTVRLRLNHSSTVALAEVGNRLDQIRNELPAEAEPPTVEVIRADRSYAAFYVAVTATTLDLPRLTEYLDREVQPRLTVLPGVQKVGLEGARPQAMRIWLDAARMDAFGISADDVQAALTRNNFLAAIGQSKGNAVQVDLLTDTDLKTEAEFEQLIVRESADSIIRLSDIARISLASEEPAADVRLDHVPAVYLSVWPLPGSNEITLGYDLRAELDRIRAALPPGVEIKMAYDGTIYMERALKEIGKTLAETVLIVGLVVFLFLGSVRTALVPLVAIPVSLVGAAGMMLALGFSFNLLTLLAIVLSVGLVVDDAIVVVENVSRFMREGRSRTEAALASARQLFGPIVAMTITLAAVYAPIGFLSGLTGVLFREFAFTLAIAVLMSGVVAITLSPVMSARFAAEGGREGWFTRRVNTIFDAVRDAYARGLDRTLRYRPPVLAFGLFVALLSVPLFLFSGKELAPVEDQGDIFIMVTSAPDATLTYTSSHMESLVDTAKSFPETDFLWQVVLPSNGFGGVVLKDWTERERSAQELQPLFFEALSQISGIQAFPVLFPALPVSGNYDVELVVKGIASPEEMAAFSQRLVGAAFGSGLFMFADTDLRIDLPQVKIAVDRERVADLGMDLAEVGRQLGVLLAGNYVNRFNYDGRAYKVVPQVGNDAKATADQLLDLKIRTPSGAAVPVSSIARLETGAAPRALTRFQQADSFRVYGGVVPGVTKEQALSALEQAAREILPADYVLDHAGESRQIRQEGNTLIGTLGFALLLIYLVLAAQFGSFRDPLVVLLGSVPLALSSALVFPFLSLTTVNIYSQVGLITLVGLIAKNGILVVEFANHLQEEGRSKLEAVREAALTRLRPVLMTTAATVVGHFPLVLVEGPGAAARNSIGIVLVAGMAIGALFTLFILPSVYMLIAADRQATPEAVPGTRETLPPVRAAAE
ncbi:efflux RND transporter permease subunit [Rhodocista pekingensis]|uniref:Efflux RND transporter permease subunit n=1 Tax=Rhodocista pekingensis TaxID=201185 RepID=A0ABW2L2D2_9PROT